MINDYEGFVVDMDGYVYLTWDHKDYILTLEGDLDKNALIIIAHSVQKRE